MSEKENVWFSPVRASVLNLKAATPGSPIPDPPLTPPDPPDPPSPIEFSPLPSSSTTSQKAKSPMQISPPVGTANRDLESDCCSLTTDASPAQKFQPLHLETANQTNVHRSTVALDFQGFTALPQKSSSPLFTNRVSSPKLNPIPSPLTHQSSDHLSSNPSPIPNSNPPEILINLSLALPSSSHQLPPPQSTSWAQKARAHSDCSLRRVVPCFLLLQRDSPSLSVWWSFLPWCCSSQRLHCGCFLC